MVCWGVGSQPIRLGAFYLQDPIGQGGMGAVWRGLHLQQHLPVAVKVLSNEKAREPRALSAFRREVRAVAALHHESIVSVLDHGVIPATTAYEARGRLVAGSPYLVMELAESTLASERPPFEWGAIKGVLLNLLEALAHAHAHGIVHRDLKPANVLWIRRGLGYERRLKLSDFGLAHALPLETGAGRSRGAGTPSYMAPEQFLGATRDFGPWTDLYSLGCVAHQLATGRRPFEERDDEALAHRHLYDPPPSVVARCEVPPGFADWVQRLLEKSPRHRFRHAADAAHALSALGEPVQSSLDASFESGPPLASDPPSGLRGSMRPSGAPEPTATGVADLPMAHEPTAHAGEPFEEWSRDEGHIVGEAPSSEWTAWERRISVKGDGLPRRSSRPPPPPEADAPTMPESWRRAEEPLPVTVLGAGLGLYNLRTRPLVGRTKERDVLWQALARVRRTRRPEAIVLRGPAGYGKTGLAEWFERRAYEVGAATSMVAVHEPGGTMGRALVRLARAHLGVRGMDRDAAATRIRARLRASNVVDDYEWRALAELVTPESPDERQAARLVRPGAHHALLRRLLRRAAEERALVVRLEDVQWGADSIDFVAHVLDAPLESMPVLFVMTAQDESLAEQSLETQRLEALAQRPEVRPLRIGALSATEHRQLLEGLLRFPGELADDLAARTAGNPLFAVHLVGDWVQRGVLEISEDGFRLREGEDAILPDDLHAVWSARVDRLVGADAGARAALEIAALAGRLVDGGEWRAACRAARIDLAPTFLDRLFASRLVVADDEGVQGPASFRFVHGMLTECLVRKADEQGRLPALHGALAESLLPRFVAGELEVAERLSLHLREAGRLVEALPALREAARQGLDASEYDRALALLDLHANAMNELELKEGHREWGENLTLRAEILFRQGALEQAATAARDAVEHASGFAVDDLLPRARYVRGLVGIEREDYEEAEGLLIDALQTFDRDCRDVDTARCLRALAQIAHREGNRAVAFNCQLAALELCRQNDDALGMAASLVGMGAADPHTTTGSAAFLEEALNLYERTGNLYGVSCALRVLGDVAKSQAKLGEAEKLYRRALRIAQKIGAAYQEARVVAGLSRVLIERGRYDEARRHLDVGWRMADRLGQKSILLAMHAGCLACIVRDEDPAAFDLHYDEVCTRLAKTTYVEPEVLFLLDHIGDACDARGMRERAQAIWGGVAGAWRRRGEEARGETVDAKAVAVG
jgi:eukaryotic-like serine/threonine-protein kinase